MSQVSEQQRKEFEKTWDQPKGFVGIFQTIDNIPISTRYMVTSFAFFIAGGILAAMMRLQLSRPGNTVLDAATYNQFFTMHGTTMMFLFVIPFLEAFANYVIPLLNGTRDLPFPRLTALSYWTYLFGGIFIYTSFLFGTAPDGGWFAYTPLTLKQFSPGPGIDFWDIGLSVAEIAAIGAASEMIVGILRMRAPGMSLNRLPIMAWAMLITSVMIIFAFTPLIVGTAMLELDRKELTRFFDARFGGDPLLWQHIFWVFGHPEVYIMFLPAIGVLSHVVQTFARRPVMSYTLVVLSMVATAFLAFGLWVHHMYTTGLSPTGLNLFAAASMAVSIPSGIQVFGWIATLWAGKPVWRTALLFGIGGIVIFVIGGITGVMVAAVPFDWQAHDTYFIVAHLHYVLIGGVIFPIFAGLYYWIPKFSGKLMNEKLGWVNFGLMFVGFNVAFFPMHLSGLEGMPRRVYTYPAELGISGYNMLSSIGAAVFALGVLTFLINVAYSLLKGRAAGNDPWQSDSLEWSETSPPSNAQFSSIPVIRSRHPMWDQATLLPLPDDDEDVVSAVKQLDHAPSRWRGSLIVGVLDGRPLALAHLPRRSFWPFIMAVGFTIVFVAALIESGPVAYAGAFVTLVSIIGWFWPVETEGIAIKELYAPHGQGPGGGTVTEPADHAHARSDAENEALPPSGLKLPLAIGDRSANGYWGVIVLMLILVAALATIIAAYFYLGNDPSPIPGHMSPPARDGVILLAGALATIVATRWLTYVIDNREMRSRALPVVGTLLLAIGMTWLSIECWKGTNLQSAESAYASSVLMMIGYGGLLSFGTAGILLAAAIWLVRVDDPRGRGVALNASLVSYGSAVSWAFIALIVYFWPRVAA
jgi:cytochrome c oxidase subunit I+III